MATLADIQNKIYALTGTDSNSYTNANMLIDLNLWQQKIVGMIFDSQDESDFDDMRMSDYPSLTTSLTTNRDYSIPVTEKVLKIKNVSISYDGTNYYRATPIDSNEIDFGQAPSSATTHQNNLDALFSKTSPRYDVKYNSIFIYPKASQTDVDAGGKLFIEWNRQATDFTSSDLTTGTAVPGFDDTFHMMLAYGCAYEFTLPNDLKQADNIKETLNDYEVRLRRQYNSKQLDRKYIIGADYQSYK